TQAADAAYACTCAADAWPVGRASAGADGTIRPGEANHARRDNLGEGAAGREQGECQVRGTGDGAAGTNRRGDSAPVGRSGKSACRRGDVLDGGSGCARSG